MTKAFFTLVGLSLIFNVFAQNPGDTIVVQTFDYSMTYGSGPWSGGERDTIAYFPDNPNLTFEKIILSYNMRCKDNVVNTDGSSNSIGCGAWDYSCNTYIHDSTRVDSILVNQASHNISNFNGSAYNYSINPIYNYTQYEQQSAVVNSIISEDTTHVGNGQDVLDFVIATEQRAHKSQFLYLATELASSALVNDTIDAISLNILSSSQWANYLSIKLKLTTDTLLSNSTPHISGFTEVYNANTLLTNGVNRFQFTNAFVWDSTSNIIVEFSLTNSIEEATTQVEGEQTDLNLGLYSNDANHITVNSAESIDIPVTALGGISEEITVSFWVNGNEDVLPQNTTIFEGYDDDGNRTVNIHFPWSNGRMYWDCGNSGTSSCDRIDKDANLAEYTGDWSQWVFTKNATTGDMKIYRNGSLWHSGSGFTRTLDIATLKLASQGNGNGYFWDGNIKEVRVFDKELSANTIANWMNKRIDNTHPDYANLVAHYPLNEGQGSTSLDNTSSQQTATFNGNVNWEFSRGDEINQFFTETTFRPNIDFYQGQYELSLAANTVLDSLLATASTVTEYEIIPNNGTLLNDEISIISSNTYWEAVSYTFDSNGNIISTTPTTVDGTINITNLPYYKRSPMAFQIMSFVTPYGAYLDLGVDGKTWYFDMTDYAPIFKGPKRITMNAGGQWQEDMDIKFLFIVGTPPRDVLEMQNIWKVESKGFTQIMNDDAFEPRAHTLLPNAEAFKVRTAITGHGQEGEFIPQNHTLNIDGGNTDLTWPVWTECAENPIFPQGGTWIYDRAGWCPGMPTDLREDDITAIVTPGQSHTFDYGINGGSGTSNYWVSSQLVSYGAPNFTVDAAVVDILSPTNKVNYIKTNPVCSKPKITIQNTGSNTLTSLVVEYWINDAMEKETYTWTGSLEFLETVIVELPDPSSLWDNMTTENNVFYVEVSNPNNDTDGYQHNNTLSSTFEPAPVYPTIFEVRLKTNLGQFGGVSESSWTVFDHNNQAVYSSGNLNANQLYQDTLAFIKGCYSFRLNDSDDDGIDFWANSDGNGYLRFKEINGTWLKLFEGDFGAFIHHEFRIEDESSIIEKNGLGLHVYPNPSNGKVTIDWTTKTSVELEISNLLGEVIWQEKITSQQQSKTIDLSGKTNGVYLLQIETEGESVTKRIILNR